MDANQTRFHIVIGQGDWEPLLAKANVASGSGEPELAWDNAGQCVTLAPRLFRFRRAHSDTPPSFAARRGAAQDAYGNTYWITPDGTEIRMLPAGARESIRYWPVDKEDSSGSKPGGFSPETPPTPPDPPVLRGLAVTEEHYLVVGESGGLILFDLHAGGPPSWLVWPGDEPIDPIDLAPRPGGGVVVLARQSGIPRLWHLNRNFSFLTHGGATGPQGEQEGAPSGAGDDALEATLEGIGLPLDVAHPVAALVLPDRSVLVLETDEAASRVHRFGQGRHLGTVDLSHVFAGVLDESDNGGGASIALRGFHFAFVSEPQAAPVRRAGEGSSVTGTLYICDAEGNQSYAFALEAPRGQEGLDLELERRYLPMRSFGGRGLIVPPGAVSGPSGEDGGARIVYDREERGVVRWVSLVEMPRPRYHPAGRLPEVGAPHVFDGKERGCVWHRVMLDALIPADTAVRIESRCSDDLNELATLPWHAEPDPYLRSGGAEIPYYRPFADRPVGCDQGDGLGTWETLLQEAKGRYLQLRITLTGNGQRTPRLRALRVYYPRFSYLKEYLPAIYQEDAASASFLERYLANPEGLFTALEDAIAHAQMLFDVRTTPEEYLEWLAGWIGLSLDAAWDERRKRLLIQHAPTLFAQRGTVAGLLRALRLATDPCPDASLFTEPISAVAGVYGGSASEGWGIRIVEAFHTRRSPGVTVEALSGETGPSEIQRRYRTFLKQRYGSVAALEEAWERTVSSFEAVEFPPVLPQGPEARDWRRFVAGPIGFTYAAVTDGDVDAYRQFLRRRYRRIERLRVADPQYAGAGASFENVSLPRRLPAAGPAWVDWLYFAAVYVPTVRRAHRFTVLVPVKGERLEGDAKQPVGLDMDVVRRVVELEKPAHTEFDVQPYWALFRVGEARLGIDTQPGRSSRLGTALVGESVLGEIHLAYTHPWDVVGRHVVGRERVQQRCKPLWQAPLCNDEHAHGAVKETVK